MKERLLCLDIAKGLGIVFIILGHTDIPIEFDSWINSFHVPLFFVISGYLYSQKTIVETIKKGWIQLLRPMWITHVICTLFLILVFSKTGSWQGPNLCTWIPQLLLLTDEGNCVGMWFIGSLFVVKTIFSILDKYFPDYKVIIAVALFLLACHLFELFETDVLNIVRGMACCIFFCIGIVLKQYKIFERRINRGGLLISLTIVAFAYKCKLFVWMFIFPLGIFSVLLSSVISVAMILLLTAFSKINYLRPISNFFQYVGMNSLFVLCIHSVIHTLQIHRHIHLDAPCVVGLMEFTLIVALVPLLCRIDIIRRIFVTR